MKRPSSRDVARLAGVSQATVSHVINGRDAAKGPVSAETRTRVLAAIRELGYQPNVTARTLRTQRSGLVALLTPDLTNPFYPLLAQAVQNVLLEHDYELLIYNSRGDARLEHRFLDKVVQRGAEGVIVVAWHLTPANVDQVLHAGMGFVSVGGDFGHPRVSIVASRDHRGAKDAVRYLVRKGHRRIAHIAGDASTLPGRLRLEGYLAALKDAGIEPDASLIVHSDFLRGSAAPLARILMSRDDPPTAVFAANDTLAVDAMLAVQALGLRVPEDVALVGYDDTTDAQLARPQLTTLRQPIDAIGQAAAHVLLRSITEPTTEPTRTILDCELIVRESA
jgi:LacI family transcriptional regulator